MMDTSQLLGNSLDHSTSRMRRRGEPKYRIHCQGHKIKVGDRLFISASEALQAYMDQYSGIVTHGSVNYDGNVTDLLDPKSVLHMTAERSRQTGVSDTIMEMKLAQSKDAVNSSHERMRKSSALRAEAQDALNRSGDLLNRIACDELEPVSTAGNSDVGSVATDLLISMHPSAGYTDSNQRSGHVYSYRTSRTRSRSLSKERPSSNITSGVAPSRELRRGESGNTKPPSSYRNISGTGKPRERSRSVSPSSFRHEERLRSNPVHNRSNLRVPSWEKTDKDPSQHKSPSWIEALDISNPGENLWSKRDLVSGRPPPSWVNGLEGSEALSSEPIDVNNLIGPPRFNSSSIRDTSMTSNPPGLTYKDLLATPTKGKSVNFDLSANSYRDKYDIASKLPKEVLNSGKQDLNNSDALDKYLEELGCGPKHTSDVDNSLLMADPSFKGVDRPRRSSLDTVALLNGISDPDKVDINESPLLKNLSGKDSSPFGGHRSRRRRPQSPDTDLVLDGDRPWEKSVGSIKAPVYVDEDVGGDATDPGTLTGRSQPGSLETLKNMLFKLQAETADQSQSNEKIAQLLATSRKELGSEAVSKLEEEIPALKGYNYTEEPGGQSLERALVHLNRLKNLVEVDKEARSRSPSRDRSVSPHRVLRSRSPSPFHALQLPS